jgi:hypothetical protein
VDSVGTDNPPEGLNEELVSEALNDLRNVASGGARPSDQMALGANACQLDKFQDAGLGGRKLPHAFDYPKMD